MAPVPPITRPVDDPNSPSTTVHNVVIVGSGPSAHTAAIYAARAQLKPVLYEGFLAGGVSAGGQLTTTSEVENFPGFPTAILGPELMDRMRKQSVACGTEIVTETISKVDFSARPFKLWAEGAEDAAPILARSVILATGATARRMHLPGEDTYWNKGVSACAVCDGPAPLFRNGHVCVVGGGDSACEEAVFLTKFASRVTLLHRRDKLRASKVMAARVLSHPNIDVLWNTVPVALLGQNVLQHIHVLSHGQPVVLDACGLFYAIGHTPNIACLAVGDSHAVEVDSDHYVVVRPGSMHTSVDGVFACGDLVDKRFRQAITAAGMGCQAALECERWLEEDEEELLQLHLTLDSSRVSPS